MGKQWMGTAGWTLFEMVPCTNGVSLGILAK